MLLEEGAEISISTVLGDDVVKLFGLVDVITSDDVGMI